MKLNPLAEFGFDEVKKIDIKDAILGQIEFEAGSKDNFMKMEEVKEKYGLN